MKSYSGEAMSVLSADKDREHSFYNRKSSQKLNGSFPLAYLCCLKLQSD